MKDYSSYGKAKILGISSKDLQNLIIQILEHRKTIRKNKVSDAVLKHMKVDIRRSTREKFERKTFRALKSLVANNIIREFKTKKDLGDEYIRVKLTPNYENRLSFPKSKRERISKFEDRDFNSIEPIDDVLDSEVFERELPDLPDSDFDEKEEPVIEEDDDYSESKHEEKDDLLKIFLGKDSDIEENDLDDKSKPLGVQQKHLLQSLHEAGYDPLLVSRFLRHSSTKISAEVYIQSSLRLMSEGLKKVDEKAKNETAEPTVLTQDWNTKDSDENEKPVTPWFSMN